MHHLGAGEQYSRAERFGSPSQREKHKLPEDANGTTSAKSLFSVASGISCVDQNRQQQWLTRGCTLSSAAQFSSATNYQRQYIQRMDTPPTDGESGVAETRTDCRRSLRIARKCTGPAVIFPSGIRCTSGSSSPPMAKCIVVHIGCRPTLQRVHEFKHALVLIARFWPALSSPNAETFFLRPKGRFVILPLTR